METVLKVLGVIGLLLIIIIVTVLVIQFGWSLFAVPVFGLKKLTFEQAAGFALLAGAFGSGSRITNS